MASQPLAPHKINYKILSPAFYKADRRSTWSSYLYKPFLCEFREKFLTGETKCLTLRQAQRAWAAKQNLAASFPPPFGTGRVSTTQRAAMVSPSILQHRMSLFSLLVFSNYVQVSLSPSSCCRSAARKKECDSHQHQERPRRFLQNAQCFAKFIALSTSGSQGPNLMLAARSPTPLS